MNIRIVFNKKPLSLLLAAGCCFAAPAAARAGWLLWEAPPAPVAAPAGERSVASARAVLPALLPAEICAAGKKRCSGAGAVLEGGETSLRVFFDAAGFKPADHSLKNVFFAGLKGLYSGRPLSGPRLAPEREYLGAAQDLSFYFGGRFAYAWRLPFRSPAGPLWLAALEPAGSSWGTVLKANKKARAYARASSQEPLLIKLP